MDPIAQALDEFVPAFEPARGDWDAIRKAAAARAVVRPERRRKPLLVAAALVATVAVTTAAVAAGLGAFNGIGAAQHPQSSTDIIDPATAAWIKSSLVGIQLDTARHIGQLPTGQNLYVITGTQNDLCTVVGPPNPVSWCGEPLSNAHPATIYSYSAGNNDSGVRWITFGIALDGVTSVSFQSTQAVPEGGPGGPEVTVPVNDNLWIYESNDAWPPYALQQVTAHFADGTSVVEPATGVNCAAC